MKKVMLSVASATILTLSFTGCANKGLDIGANEVKQIFKEGSVSSTQKVLVTKTKMAVLGGAGVGAIGGAIADGSAKGAVIGSSIGALVGGVASQFQEIEAYETSIQSGKDKVVAYLEKRLPENTIVEFVVRGDGEITNVNVIEKAKPQVVYKEKIVEKPIIVEKEKITKEVKKEI